MISLLYVTSLILWRSDWVHGQQELSHQPLVRVRLDRTMHPSRSKDEGPCELDVSQWITKSETYELRASPSLRGTDETQEKILGRTLRTRLRMRRPVERLEEKEELIEEERIAPHVLQAVSKPLVPSDVWDRLTGREFDTPVTVEKLAQSGISVVTALTSNEWIDWKPHDRYTSHSDEQHRMEALESDHILVYVGKWRQPGYGSHLPVVRTQSIVDMSPKEMAELLLDSSRVKTYNKLSLGRRDVRVMQLGVDTDGNFGKGETKIVRNITHPPISKKQILSVTMMHGRPLRPNDGIPEGGYVVVSRAVRDPGEETSAYAKSEILLGINVLQNLEDPNRTLVTAATHVYSPSLPTIVASRVGVSSAVNFIKDVRKVCKPRVKT